jgi:hypothetical protein
MKAQKEGLAVLDDVEDMDLKKNRAVTDTESSSS